MNNRRSAILGVLLVGMGLLSPASGVAASQSWIFFNSTDSEVTFQGSTLPPGTGEHLAVQVNDKALLCVGPCGQSLHKIEWVDLHKTCRSWFKMLDFPGSMWAANGYPQCHSDKITPIFKVTGSVGSGYTASFVGEYSWVDWWKEINF